MHSSHKSAFLKAAKIAFKIHGGKAALLQCWNHSFSTAAPDSIQVSLPRAGKANRKAGAQKREIMKENFAVNCTQNDFKLSRFKCLLPPPHLTVTLSGGVGFADQPWLIPYSGNLPRAAFPTKTQEETFRISHTLLETVSRTWPQRNLQKVALFLGIFLLTMFCPIFSVPSLIWFIPLFLSLVSLSLPHIISLEHLPDQEEKLLLILTLTLVPHHLKGFSGWWFPAFRKLSKT